MQKQRWKEIRRIYNFLISGIPKTNTVLKVFALGILVQRYIKNLVFVILGKRRMQEMSKTENCHRPKNMPGRTNPAKLTDQEKSDRMIEIPLSTQTDASNVIPDEVPRHDGPGGE